MPVELPESEIRKAKAKCEAFRAAVTVALQTSEFGRTRLLVSVKAEKSMGSETGFSVYLSSAFVEQSQKVETVAEAEAFAREVEAARLAGAVPRELLVQGTPAPPSFNARKLHKVPKRFANVLPKGHILRP